jgi:hypothetical protein
VIAGCRRRKPAKPSPSHADPRRLLGDPVVYFTNCREAGSAPSGYGTPAIKGPDQAGRAETAPKVLPWSTLDDDS